MATDCELALRKAVYAQLDAVVALNGIGLYANVTQDTAYPYVVIGSVIQKLRAETTTTSKQIVRFQLDVFTELSSPISCSTWVKALVEALTDDDNKIDPTADGWTLIRAIDGNNFTGNDLTPEGGPLWHGVVSMIYNIQSTPV